MTIKETIKSIGTPKVVEAFVAGQFVATDAELKHLHTERPTSMALAMQAAASK